MTETTSSPSPVHAGEADRFGGWQWSDPARGEHFRRCSYCGSMHPDDLVSIARGRVDWADRKYGWPHKFYVHVPNQTPGQVFVVGGTSHYDPDRHRREDLWFQPSELTDEQREVVERDGWRFGLHDGGAVQLGTRAEHFGKVYTVHLADPNISDETRAAAAAMCGLRFEFIEGIRGPRIRWEPAR